MAIARVSPIIGGISGSINATTFRNTRQGLVIASRGQTCGKNSDKQIAMQASIGLLRERWINAGPVAQDRYKAAAREISWPNRLGIPKHPSAWNLFLCCNMTFFGGPIPESHYALTNITGTQCAPPTSFSCSLTMSTGLTVTSASPLLPDVNIYEILFLSFKTRRYATYPPRSWIRVGILQKSTATLDYTALATFLQDSIQEGQHFCYKIVWTHLEKAPSIPVWGNAWVTA